MSGGRIRSQAKRQRLKRQRERLAAEQGQQDSVTVDANDRASNVQLGSGGKYGPTGFLPARSEAKLLERAVRNGWLEDGQTQRFETRTSENELTQRVSSQSGEASIMERLSLSVLSGLNDKDKRRRGIAERTALAMERANQRDEHHSDDLEIKRALLEARGGHTDDSIPCGVVLLTRPCTSIEEWEAQVALAEADQKRNVDPMDEIVIE
jgi:hypothetical protein